MWKLSVSFFLSFFSLTLFYTSKNVEAAYVSPQPIEKLVSEANFIFKGKVISIVYKNSKPDELHPAGIPHTFVTYAIEKVLRGKPMKVFTLRFFGGMHMAKNGKLPIGAVMAVDGYPEFDVGDVDYMLVKNNTNAACPLTGCQFGRQRVINSKLFSETGKSLCHEPNRNYFWGGSYYLPETAQRTFTHPITGKSVVVDTRGDQAIQNPVEQNQYNIVEFETFLQALISGLPQPKAEKNADTNANFAGPILKASPYLAQPLQGTPYLPHSNAERIEIKKFLKNNQNPVIPQ